MVVVVVVVFEFPLTIFRAETTPVTDPFPLAVGTLLVELEELCW